MKFKRIFVLVLDSLGVGEALDAASYGDSGANTLKHIMENYDLFIPNLKKLGFTNTLTMEDSNEVDAYYTIARPNNKGKDSVAGHYEIFALPLEEAFVNFDNSPFPLELIEKIEASTKERIIGNKVTNAQSILEELGERHLSYGALILFSSADSSLEIAAHEDIVPLPKLYKYCEIIRKITADNPKWRVSRVVARPFKGKINNFKFTSNRKDYVIRPNKKTIFDELKQIGLDVISIGKITDIFAGEGITKIVNARKSNIDTLTKLADIMQKNFEGLCVTNLNDFDENYGHTRDLEGYAKSIEELDVEIPMLLNKLSGDDLFIMTADHGCDPSLEGFTHTRENVPVIIFSRNFKEPKKIEVLETMADIGASIADNFDLDAPPIGKSFLDKLN